MGCQLSRPVQILSHEMDLQMDCQAIPDHCREELSSYQEAVRRDPNIQTFDSNLQRRLSLTFSNVAADSHLPNRALSFDSMKNVAGCLLNTNQEVVNIILGSKEDIWNNRELFDLVKEYFENSKKTLDFCVVLEKCLKKARHSVLIAELALNCYSEDEHGQTLEELKNFKEAGEPFDEEFFGVLNSVREQQILMLRKLRSQRGKLKKKLKSAGSWRKISGVIFVAAVTGVLICSVVAAAMAAPPVAAALAAAASVPLGSMGKWIDNLWREYEKTMKEQKELVENMELHSYIVMSELDDIKVFVDNLQIHLGSLLSTSDFALQGDVDAGKVRFGIEEMKKKIDLFKNSIEDLGVQARRCSRDTEMARTVVLQRIISHRNGT